MKLASIEKIIKISDIEGADRIQAAQVLGYQSVIKKNEFNAGDLVVFIFPDSLLPRKPWNQFLWPKEDQNPDGERVRLRGCKFKKQISQGLIQPLNILPNKEYKEGDDVTGDLDILKYEKPVPAQLAGKIRGNFPSHLFPKTDETNLCSYPRAVDEFVGLDCYISQKYDGSSMSVYINDDFSVCSRNLDLKEEDGNAFWKIARQFDLESKIRQFGFKACIQGELVGPGVNGNKMGLSELSFRAFNIYNIEQREFADFNTFIALCEKFQIPRVSVIWDGIFDKDLDWLIELSKNQEYQKGYPAEGIVLRSQVPKYSQVLKERLSGKVINPIFAAKYGE